MRKINRKKYLQSAASAAVTGLFIWFIWRNLAQIQASFHQLMIAPKKYLILSIFIVIATFALAAFSYVSLAFARLNLRRMFIVELAAATITRLLPAGLGGMGTHALFLRKHHHSMTQSASVVAVNNTLGFLTHLWLLLMVALFFPSSLTGLSINLPTVPSWAFWAVPVLIFGVLSISRIRSNVSKAIRSFMTEIKRYKDRPKSIMAASLFLILLTLCNVIVLYLALQAAAPNIIENFDLVKGLVVYSAGVLFGAAVPTPGGLAGVEAGLVAGLMAFGAPFQAALTVTLGFRLVTYWLPILPGAIAAMYARRQNWI